MMECVTCGRPGSSDELTGAWSYWMHGVLWVCKDTKACLARRPVLYPSP